MAASRILWILLSSSAVTPSPASNRIRCVSSKTQVEISAVENTVILGACIFRRSGIQAFRYRTPTPNTQYPIPLSGHSQHLEEFGAAELPFAAVTDVPAQALANLFHGPGVGV